MLLVTNIVVISVAGCQLEAIAEMQKAPRTCAAFMRMLPAEFQLIQARWSGEAAWIPLGDTKLDVPYENHTSYPAPGQILLYPGGISEAEILVPYGSTCFSSKVGQLAGNHFLTVVEGGEHLQAIGRAVLWQGAQAIRFALASR